jgi:peroxiredoxin
MQAPNFAFTDTAGNVVHLADLKGKLLLIDIWYTGCGGCAGFYQHVLSRVESLFKDSKALAFVSISADRDATVWKKSIYSGRYSSAAVVNLYTNGIGYYHELFTYYNLFAFPTTFLLDANGKMLRFFNAPDLYDPAPLIAYLQQCMLHSK